MSTQDEYEEEEDDEDDEDWLEEVMDEIMDVTDCDLEVYIVDNIDGNEMQAQSFPDGRIEVTERLYDELDEEELIYVLCHEAAHVELEHNKRLKDRIDEYKNGIIKRLSDLDRVQKERGRGLVVRSLTQIIGSFVQPLIYGGFMITQDSQEHEFEADLRAAEIMEELEYEQDDIDEAIVGALKKLHRGYLYKDGFWSGLLSTHPDDYQRVNKIEERE